MMHDYPRWFLFACTALVMSSIRAQQIFIPDVELRAVYNTWVPGSVDVDGYLDASLQGVQEFDGNAMFSSSPVQQLNGLEAFISLRNLYFYGNAGPMSISSLPPNLEHLHVEGNQISELPTLPSSLKSFNALSYTLQDLPSLNEGLVHLNVYCTTNFMIAAFPSTLRDLRLASLPEATILPPLPNGLKRIELSYSTTDVLSSLPDMSGTELESIVLAGVLNDVPIGEFPQSLNRLFVYECVELTTIPTLPQGLDSLTLGVCPYLSNLPPLPDSLKFLNIYDCALPVMPDLPEGLIEMYTSFVGITELPELPSTLRLLTIEYVPGLNCMPVLPDSLAGFSLFGTNVHCLPNFPADCQMDGSIWLMGLCSVMNTICPTQNPGIGGHVFHDVNTNGVLDDGEPGCNYVSLLVEPLGYAGGVPLNGQYDLGLDPGDYTITCVPYMPFVQNVAPLSHTASLPTQTSYESDNDFALTIPLFEDVSLALTGWSFCPGFDRPLWITVTSQGTLVSDVPVELTFDTDQTFVESWPPPTGQSGNSLTWTLGDMVMGEQRSILVILHTDVSIPLGTAISQVATTGAMPNDAHPENNTSVWEDVVVGSFDPNDKTVSPSTIDASELASTELTYTIRFQNTGTYHAERVIITDTLSTSLDWTSFRFVASSHTCNWTLFNGVLRFTFEPIYLPDSTNDEPGSHGFVTFSMKPDVTTGLGPIGNVANIYFDYNAPVITNEAVVDISTGTPMPERTGVRLFPIPAQEFLWIQRASSGTALASVIDAQGRTLLTRVVNGTPARLEVGELPPGAYVLELRSDSIERIPFLKQ